MCFFNLEGIISWPSPTADKVFFLTPPSQTRKKSLNPAGAEGHEGGVDDEDEMSEIEEEEVQDETNNQRPQQSSHHQQQHHQQHRQSVLSNGTKAECVQLDITADRHNPYGLQFDDVYWDRYLSSLKPLGLAILLNNCNPDTQQDFMKFGDHIACESMHNEVSVPVMNKRCLCELARQIGFKENAIKGYDYFYQVSLFRHIRPEVIQSGRLAKSLNFPRLKMPFPNMMCAVIKDTFANTSQLFSQGTGDLVLDACAEYWNGESLVLLTDYERKKILDFYQRSSLTSYCCAFAYLPLINDDDHDTIKGYLEDNYIELPPDSSHLFPSQRALDANLRGLALDSHAHHHPNASPNLDQILATSSMQKDPLYLDPQSKTLGHHLSSDTIVKTTDMSTGLDDGAGDGAEETKTNLTETKKMEKIMKKVVNEVFIGMTTLQYQACSDFVRLIELLEAGKFHIQTLRIVDTNFQKFRQLALGLCIFPKKMNFEVASFRRRWASSLAGTVTFRCSTKRTRRRKMKPCPKMRAKLPNPKLISRPTIVAILMVSWLLPNNQQHCKLFLCFSVQVKFTKGRRSSLSSLSSTDSIVIETGHKKKGNDNTAEDGSEEVSDKHAAKEDNAAASVAGGSRVKGRRKQNSFSMSSERSGSVISTSRRLKEMRKLSYVAQRNLSPSPSRLTTASTVTDHSAPIGFDMSNRAKLPKGIDNIRPHLENVDNVPLLVSLFTDCTPEATREMIKIMQENEEVVCVIGSISNDANVPIFIQADAR